MRKKNFDLIVPLGNACSCSMSLRKARLQLLSFPYDWLTPGSGEADVLTDLGNRVENICNDFKDWLNLSDFEIFADSEPTARTEYVRNPKMNMLFLHDFPKGVPLSASFAAVNAKYQKRIRRLLTLIRASKRVLFLRMDRPESKTQTPVDCCQDALQKLSGKFPGVTFEMTLLQQDASIPFSRRRYEDLGGGLTRIRFDYRSPEPNADVRAVNLKLTARALRTLYSVRDYRTPEERKTKRIAEFRRLLTKLTRPFVPKCARGTRTAHQ